MIKNGLIFVLIALACCKYAHAQIVADPLANGLEKGRVYMKWVVDIDHNGYDDVLLGEKPSEEESKDDPFPELQGFGIYFGQKDGSIQMYST